MNVITTHQRKAPLALLALILCLLPCFSSSLYSQSFQMAYGGVNDDIGRSIIVTPDGGFLVMGTSISYGSGGEDAFVVKLDGSGNVEWTRTLGLADVEWGWNLENYDGDYLVVGSQESASAGGQDGIVARLDPTGVVLWVNSYGGPLNEYFRTVAISDDNQIFCSGYTSGISANDISIVKMDGAGTVIWQKTYGGGANDFPHDLITTPDLGVLSVGYRRDYLGGTNYTGYLLKTDAIGTVEWTYDYNIGASSEYMEAAVMTSDGGYTICGGTNSSGAGGLDGWVTHVDSLGDVVWTRTYGGASNDFMNGILITPDGGYIFSGYTQSFGSGGQDLMLVKTDAAGVLQWTRTLGGPANDFCQNATHNVKNVPGGGYAMVGQTLSFGSGINDYFVARTDPNGFADSCFQTSPGLTTLTPLVTKSAIVFTELIPAWGVTFSPVITAPVPDTSIVCCPVPLARMDIDGVCGSFSFTFTDSSLGVGSGTTFTWDFNADLIPDAVGPGPHTYVFPGPGSYPVGLLVQNICGNADTAVVLVTVAAGGIVLTPTSCDVSCNGAGDGTASVAVTGIGPFSYLWNTIPPSSSPSVSGLGPGVYTVIVLDSTLGCTDSVSVTITEPTPVSLAMASDSAGCSGAGGMASVTPSGGNGNYSYLWSTSSTDSSITGLAPGMYYVTVTDTFDCGGTAALIYFQDFEGAHGWGLNIPTGINGPDNNYWEVDDDESGVPPPGCGAAGLGNKTMHITSQFCPTCGAAYDAGGFCGILTCPETNMAAYSPLISTVGYSNLNLSFDFISNGQGFIDNAAVYFNDGTGWAVLAPSIKSPVCAGGQGQWTNITFPLPPSTWGIPNMQVGFKWANNDDGVGTDPSVAINDLRISMASTPPVLCTYTDSVFVSPGGALNLIMSSVDAPCGLSGSAAVDVLGGSGHYSYLWSTGDTTDSIIGPAGTYYLTVTDTIFSGGGGGGTDTLYFETFDPPGAWTLNVPTGVNGADPNFWQIDDDESGVPPPGCGAAGLGNQSLHITSVFCPTCGAAYDAGGLCGILFCPETNMAAYSPPISTVGSTAVNLSFDFISNGSGLLDNASVFYNDGLGWALLSPSIKSAVCGGGQGQWTNISFPLPASCAGIPNLQVGFNWTNNDDGVGTDPSVAINNVIITSPDTSSGGGFSLCIGRDSVNILATGGPTLVMTDDTVACGSTGTVAVGVTSSGGPFAYLWSTGDTTSVVTGLPAGSYTVTVTDTISVGGGGGGGTDTLYFETFDPPGAWTLNVPTGVNGADPNFWQIDDDESGVPPPGCGAAGLGNQSLHITSVFCPTCGAAYDAGGLCGILFCPETNMAAYSPPISTVGSTAVTLSFDFISNGSGLLDNASVFYNDGLGWALLSPSIKSLVCAGGQGQWTNISFPLPASCAGIPNLQVGFNWTNNDDGVGTDPSVAINNVIITAPDTSSGGGSIAFCTSVGVANIISSGGPALTLTSTPVMCTDSGTATVSVTTVGGPYDYLWSTGDTTDTITGLAPGVYYVTVTDTVFSGGGGGGGTDTLYFETFDPAGAWTLNVPTGVNGTDPNFWQIDDDESGVPPPGCGAAGLGNQSLHITSVFCPTCGAAYDAGGLCGILFCPETNMAAYSPPVSTVGFSSLTLSFDFISNGDALLDNASVFYNDGSGWALLSPSIKSPVCAGGQGQWTNTSFALPASCAGIPNLQVGFNWTNNDDGVGTDPSVAINNVIITAPDTSSGSGSFVLCTSVDSVTVLTLPSLLTLDVTGTLITCGGLSNGTVTAVADSGIVPYVYIWSTGDTTASVDSLGAGWYYVTVTDGAGCTATDSFEVTSPSPLVLVMSSTIAPCSFATGTASVAVSGGVPGYTYSWSPGGGATPTITGLLPGTYTVTVTDANSCFSVNSVTVAGTTNPIADAGLPASFCEGEGGAQLFGSAVGGTAPYYFEWWCAAVIAPCGIDSVFDDDPIVNPTASGWYYVQVTDFNGCVSNVDSVFVTENPKPIVDAGPDLWICGPPAPCEMVSPTISGSPGPFSYVWDPPLGLSNDTILTPCARPDTTTIYTLTVTDLTTGCTSEATTTDTLSSVTVHVSPVPIADAGPDRDLCLLDTLMLLGVGYGAGPSYTYQWSPFSPPVTLSANNIPNPLAFPDLTTDYVLVVWSGGCPSYGDTVTVNVHTNPTVDAGPDRDICRFESVLIDGQAGGDSTSSFYTYLWFDGSTLDDPSLEDPTATPDTTTMYYVIATSEYGCESPTDSVLITVKPTPIPDAGPPIQICAGDSVLIPTSIYYDGTPPAPPSAIWPAWLPAVNINDTTLLQPTVWPTSTGFYYVTLQYNTCFATDSVLITVIPGPQVTLDADTAVFCEGQITQLHASGGLGGASFTWIPGYGLSDSTGTDPFASPDSTTTYIVMLEEGGCSNSDTITLTVIPTPEMGYYSSQPTGCAPLDVSFLQDTKDALFYSWDFGDGVVSNEPNPVHTYTTPGIYHVVLTAVNTGGCEGVIDTIVIEVTDPGTAEFTADPSFPVEMSLPNTNVQFTDKSTFAVSWIWDFGDNFSSVEQNPSHAYQQPGEYSVTLTTRNVDGCISQVTHGPFVVKSPDLFIPNVFSPNDDNSNDFWIVRYSGDQPFQADIFDRWGKRMYSSRNKTEGWDGTDLKGNKVPAGVYFYRVLVGEQEYAGDVTLLR